MKAETAELIDDLRGSKRYLEEAVKKARTMGNYLVSSLVQEALDSIESALCQVNANTVSDSQSGTGLRQ